MPPGYFVALECFAAVAAVCWSSFGYQLLDCRKSEPKSDIDLRPKFSSLADGCSHPPVAARTMPTTKRLVSTCCPVPLLSIRTVETPLHVSSLDPASGTHLFKVQLPFHRGRPIFPVHAAFHAVVRHPILPLEVFLRHFSKSFGLSKIDHSFSAWPVHRGHSSTRLPLPVHGQ